MPYASQAQRGLFHAKEERGEISPATVHEFDEASKGMKLPKHVHHMEKAAHHLEKSHHHMAKHHDHLMKAMSEVGHSHSSY